jgi:3-deoxy-7-phosphoheptulonate synthase
VFRGEAVNRPEPDEYARRADVRRLLAAYDHAAQALDALFINRFLPLFTDAGQPGYAPTYVSHEALLLEYESALVRCGEHGQPYASSAHLLWIGERTRQPDGAHVAFAASITNPVAVKIGPTATVDEVAALIDRLGGPPGRLTLIVRMGARAVTALARSSGSPIPCTATRCACRRGRRPGYSPTSSPRSAASSPR